jgi:hypothetical protein
MSPHPDNLEVRVKARLVMEPTGADDLRPKRPLVG